MRFLFIRFLAVLCVLSDSASSFEADAEFPAPPPEKILSLLKKEHPRLLATAKDFDTLKQIIARNAEVKKWHDKVRADAVGILRTEPSKYEIPDGKRLLATSRRVLGRVRTLALIYRLDGGKEFADRAWRELKTAADFKDWNPRTFLDTAEMTHAFAIGYDWLYDVWTPEQREILRNAIVEKGFKPALPFYREKRSFVALEHNWNQVCNGGIGMGALALADVEPAMCGMILHGAIESLPRAMRHFGPDGAWAEGPGYWDYATSYNCVFLAALDSALGTDFCLSKIPGFSKTGAFPVYFTSPTGRLFNYADTPSAKFGGASQLFWFASKFKQPAFAAYDLKFADASPQALDLIWGAAWAEKKPKMAAYPTARYFRNSEVVTMRSAWNDPNATFVGFKAGDNKVNHVHLDLGSFVLDALGHRWAVDFGPDDYNLHNYFGKGRWDFYRLRAEGHNTLVINPGAQPDQDPRAAARITRFESKADTAFAITDLSHAYAAQAGKVVRGIKLLDRKQVLIEDEVNAPKPSEIWWFMHTPAKIQTGTDGDAMLSIGGERLWVKILSPANVRFTTKPAGPLPTSPRLDGQRVNKEQTLAIHLEKVTQARVTVLLVPLRAGKNPPTRLLVVKPLAEW